MILGQPQSQGDKVQSTFLPPPLGGWNTRDGLPVMAETDAIELINWYPDTDAVRLRKGYRYHSKSIGSNQVIALGNLSTAGNNYFIAVGSDRNIYNASIESAAASSIMGPLGPFGGDPIHIIQFRDRLFIASTSNADVVFCWIGSGSIFAAGFSGPGGSDNLLRSMTSYKGRLYFAEALNPSIWYGGLGAITGALTEFSVSSILRQGGSIRFISTLSRVKDFNEDQLFVVVSDRGEVLLYQGDYPGSSAWALTGQYTIPAPLGPRAFFHWGADLLILTVQGLLSLNQIIGNPTTSDYTYLGAKISRALKDAATDSLIGDIYWGGLFYPKGNYLFLNVPVISGAISHQYVMNVNTGAWCKFTNQNAFDWAIHRNNLYFGGLSGRVFKADNGTFDEDPASEGASITMTTKIRQAYSNLGDASHKKHIHLIQPILKQDTGLAVKFGVNVDFNDTEAGDFVQDLTDLSFKFHQPLIKVAAIGKFAGIKFDHSYSSVQLEWYGTNILYETGGVR